MIDTNNAFESDPDILKEHRLVWIFKRLDAPIYVAEPLAHASGIVMRKPETL